MRFFHPLFWDVLISMPGSRGFGPGAKLLGSVRSQTYFSFPCGSSTCDNFTTTQFTNLISISASRIDPDSRKQTPSIPSHIQFPSKMPLRRVSWPHPDIYMSRKFFVVALGETVQQVSDTRRLPDSLLLISHVSSILFSLCPPPDAP